MGSFTLSQIQLLVRNQTQDMRDAVEASLLLVVRAQNVPRQSIVSVALRTCHARQSNSTTAARWQVHGTQFPLPQRILDTRFKAALLFVIADFQPVLDNLDPDVLDDIFSTSGQSSRNGGVALSCKNPSHTPPRPGCTSCDQKSRSRPPRGNVACNAVRTSATFRDPMVRVGPRPERPEGSRASVIALNGAAFTSAVAPFEYDHDIGNPTL